MAVNEIDESNGPLVTLKKKDPLKIFYRVKNEIGTNLRGERGKISDRNFNYLLDNEDNSFKNLKVKRERLYLLIVLEIITKAVFVKKITELY